MIDWDKVEEAKKELEDYARVEMNGKDLNQYTQEELDRYDELLENMQRHIVLIKDAPRK